MDAWQENLYGLIAIQRFVAEGCGMECGAITIFSHSISIDPSMLEKATQIARLKKTDHVVDQETGKVSLRFDPNGELTVTVDGDELVAEHSYQGMKIGEYRGKRAEEIEDQLARDCVISEISHALYIGRQLALAAAKLKKE